MENLVKYPKMALRNLNLFNNWSDHRSFWVGVPNITTLHFNLHVCPTFHLSHFSGSSCYVTALDATTRTPTLSFLINGETLINREDSKILPKGRVEK